MLQDLLVFERWDELIAVKTVSHAKHFAPLRTLNSEGTCWDNMHILHIIFVSVLLEPLQLCDIKLYSGVHSLVWNLEICVPAHFLVRLHDLLICEDSRVWVLSALLLQKLLF